MGVSNSKDMYGGNSLVEDDEAFQKRKRAIAFEQRRLSTKVFENLLPIFSFPWHPEEEYYIQRYQLQFYERFNEDVSQMTVDPFSQRDYFTITQMFNRLFEQIPPLMSPLVVWRGQTIAMRARATGLISTSLERHIAERFGTNFLYRIIVPAGAKVIAQAGNIEQEIILPATGEFYFSDEQPSYEYKTLIWKPSKTTLKRKRELDWSDLRKKTKTEDLYEMLLNYKHVPKNDLDDEDIQDDDEVDESEEDNGSEYESE